MSGVGMRGFTVLNIRVMESDHIAGTAVQKIFDDNPNRFGAVMWCAGGNTAHVVVSKDSGVAVTHDWGRFEEIATWNNPVVVPWWDKKARYSISRDATQTLHVIEYVNEEAVSRQ